MAAKKPRTAKKTAKKTAKRPELVAQPNGKGALLSGGAPGNRGGTGRPPDAFRELCRELASRRKTIGSILAILKDPTHQQFMAAVRWATEHGYGKPVQPLQHSVDETLSALIARAYRE